MSPRYLSFHFTLRDAQGRLRDTSRGGAPAAFLEGAGQIIEGLEGELLSMTIGESRAVIVPPERGYGPVDESLRQSVLRASLPVAELKVGDRFQTGPDRHAPVVTVLAVEGDKVLLDANHPLAGQWLHFDIDLLAVRRATLEEEIAAGLNGRRD